jgi:Lipocalin-like domain
VRAQSGLRTKICGADGTSEAKIDFQIGIVPAADNSRIASNDPSMTQSEEGGLIVESIAYYGTYTVNEEVNVISLHLDASTFPNQVGTDQKRSITSLTANELKYTSPAAKSGDQVHQVWKRAQ